jgi:ParB family transcriptional regulator, chromosome partitioning protein
VKTLLNDGKLSAGHGRALLNAPNPAAVAQAVVSRALNVRQTEEMVQRALRDGTSKAVRTAKDADIQALEKEFSELLGMKCTINYRNDRGSLNVRFEDLSSLGQLIAKLQRATH